MKIKFKRLKPNAITPKFGREDDAGADLTVVDIERIEDDDDSIKYNFGIAVEIPKNHVGLLFARSSIYKKKQILTNSVGVIDHGYIGEISAVMTVGLNEYAQYKVGERAVQLIIMPIPSIEFEEVEELSDSERGTQGYGSSGN